MVWVHNFGVLEMGFVIAFTLLYAVYIIRTLKVAKKLNTAPKHIASKLILRILLFALLIIAFLGPLFGASQREVKSIGKDIMICVDLSKSMDASDIQPTRLEKIKFEMKRIIAAFGSDQIGIIIFSSEAFMQSPLTYDKNALNLFVEAMHTGLVPSSGTDFGPPLRMGLNKLNSEKNTRTTQQKSKIIILISDGEDFGEDTNDVIATIQEKNIQLYTLGVGTSKGSRLFSGKKIKKDKQGNTIITRLNSASLRSLAESTGGRYFEINENRNDIARLIDTISQIEGELKDTRYIDLSDNRYQIFLVIALFLLLIDSLASVKIIKI